MGWDYTHRDRGTSNLDWFRDQWDSDNYELLDGATVGSTFYGAVRERATGHVFAAVTMTRWAPRDWFNFGKKDMTETWGPTEARCPDRILDMLTDVQVVHGTPEYGLTCMRHTRCADKPDDEHVRQELDGLNGAAWALKWRKACRDYNARVAKVKRGVTILHAGSKYTAVDLRRNLFRGEYGTLYRFPHWRTVNFEVIPAA